MGFNNWHFLRLISFLSMGLFAFAGQLVGTDNKIIPYLSIAVLVAILISHFSLYRNLRKPQGYKWKWVVWMGAIIAYAVLAKAAVGAVIKPSIYEYQLKSELSEVTYIKVSPVVVDWVPATTEDDELSSEICMNQSSEISVFEETDCNKIQEIIENIQITPFNKTGYCDCCGNQSIEFYHDNELCVKLTFHHGKRLRWSGWNSDMRLTNQSAAYLKGWLSQNGIENFE